MSKGMPLNDLFRFVPIDDRIEAFKGPTAHDIPDALFLHPEPLDLIIDVEKQAIITR